MSHTKPNIVLCNDDGIDAPGIHRLWEAVHEFAKITIVAPAADQSCKGVGFSIPATRIIEAERVKWPEGVDAWRVFGTPADCAKFALHHLFKKAPDLILSGINNGTNAGRNIMHSGTIGAVIQATMCKVPGIAFSCMYEENIEKFKKAQPYILEIVKHFRDHQIPKGTLMNVNFPNLLGDENLLGFRMARQGRSFWDARIGSNESLKGTNKYPILDTWDMHEEHQDSDIHLLTQGYITCVPIQIEDLTDHSHRTAHAPLFEKLNDKFTFSSE
jgi:5'-nucleotidase